jgi:hypothetical protein
MESAQTPAATLPAGLFAKMMREKMTAAAHFAEIGLFNVS